MTATAVPPSAPLLPSRERPRGTAPLETLFDLGPASGDDGRGLTPELAARYGGDLRIALRSDRPVVVANFVETLDGAAALDTKGRTGGGEVSGFSPTDRFVMGLLRALADVVLVGAGTVRSSSRGRWTPDAVAPDAAPAFGRLRAELGLPPQPTTLIVTATGELDPDQRVFHDPAAPVVVAAPPRGFDRLRGIGLPDHVRLEPLGAAASASDLLAVAVWLGARLVTCEGGPSLIAQLIGAGALDELFLTLAPQLVGRDPGHPRLGLVEGLALWPAEPTWLDLRSVRRTGDHLLLRYSFAGAA
ncbi:MAG TPA: dihydrofolate reductase family protein [Candidatus Limnocylindrales bacterium]